MKFLYSSLLILSSSFVFAQKLDFEGIITFSISNPDAASAQQSNRMSDRTLTVYFKGDMIKTVMSSAANKFIIITDATKPAEFILLQEITGHRYLQARTEEDKIDIKKALDNKAKEHQKITYKDETKEIAGYTCHRALVSLIKNHDSSVSTVYYTDKLPKRGDISALDFKDLSGLPLEYDQHLTPVVHWMYTAISVVRQSLPDSTFIPSADYIPATQEEIMLKIREYRTGEKPDDDMKN